VAPDLDPKADPDPELDGSGSRTRWFRIQIRNSRVSDPNPGRDPKMDVNCKKNHQTKGKYNNFDHFYIPNFSILKNLFFETRFYEL
jgi:hypothetical protein